MLVFHVESDRWGGGKGARGGEGEYRGKLFGSWAIAWREGEGYALSITERKKERRQRHVNPSAGIACIARRGFPGDDWSFGSKDLEGEHTDYF